MGSPFSPVVVNFCIEKFEELAITSALLKPKCWFRYVENIFMVWSHGEEKLLNDSWHISSVFIHLKWTISWHSWVYWFFTRPMAASGTKYMETNTHQQVVFGQQIQTPSEVVLKMVDRRKGSVSPSSLLRICSIWTHHYKSMATIPWRWGMWFCHKDLEGQKSQCCLSLLVWPFCPIFGVWQTRFAGCLVDEAWGLSSSPPRRVNSSCSL